MLVVIDPSLGSPDTYKTRYINMVRAIKAVMTASAGSTPSVIPFASASGVGANSTSMITVIANTEAGGWSVGSGDNIPTTTYSTSTDYYLDLYVQNTGSATYPYHKFCMTAGDSKTQGQYAFSSGAGFNSYPIVSVWHGAHTGANLVNGDAFWNSTTQVPSMYYTSYYTSSRGPLYPNKGAFMMSVTANYVHFVNLAGTAYTNASLSYGTTGTGAYTAGFGLRQLQLWESGSAYAASSPGVCGFWVTHDTDYNSVYYPAAAFFWGQRINKDGSIASPVKYVNQQNFGNGPTSQGFINAVTGLYGYPGTAANTYNMDAWALRGYGPDQAGYGYRQTNYATVALPLFLLSTHCYNVVGLTPPVSDSSTGALVPPAYPVLFSNNYMDPTYSNMNPGNKIAGIFKSLSAGYAAGGATYRFNMSAFVTLNQTYVVDGDNYFPALTGWTDGWDLFLLRKA